MSKKSLTWFYPMHLYANVSVCLKKIESFLNLKTNCFCNLDALVSRLLLRSPLGLLVLGLNVIVKYNPIPS